MKLKITHTLKRSILFFSLLLAAPSLFALQIQVTDTNGKHLEDAVIMVLSNNGKPFKLKSENNIVVDQRDKEFIPHVTTISIGSSVIFPNNDNIRHQVYSFSDAKNFEIPLYKGNPDRPVTFEKEGIVALGCNIHDWMKAYIVVSPTPHYVVTDNQGRANLKGLPKGELLIQVWHPSLKGSIQSTQQTVQYSSAKDATLPLSIKTKKVWRAFRSPNNSGSGGYK